MKHPEEGTVHAWLDGALEPDDAQALETHVAQCAECRAMVAEARGLIAAASRVVSQLDGVSAQVMPAVPRRAAPSRVRSSAAPRNWWRYSGLAAAAVFGVVSASWVSMQGSRAALELRTEAASVREPVPVGDRSDNVVAAAENSAVASAAPVMASGRASETSSERKSAAPRVAAARVAAARVAAARTAEATVVASRAAESSPQRLLGPARSRTEALPQVVVTSASGVAAITAAPVLPSTMPPSAVAASMIASSTMTGCYALSPVVLVAGGTAAGVTSAPLAGASAARSSRAQAAFAAPASPASAPLLRLTDSLTSVAIDARALNASARDASTQFSAADASARERAAVAYIGYASGLVPRASLMSDAPTGNTLVRWSALGDDLLRVHLLNGASVLVRVSPDGNRLGTTLPRADFTARRTACP